MDASLSTWSTVSFWQYGHFPTQWDTIIIGAGIVGSFSALFHKRRFPHHRVLVLERGAYPQGATVRNAGFACFGSASEILADIGIEGADVALGRVEQRWKGLAHLRQELGDAAIGFEPCGGAELFPAGSPELQRVQEGLDGLNAQLRSMIGPNTYRWADDALASTGMQAARMVFTPAEGALDSGALMTTLLAKLKQAGVEVRMGVDVTAVEDGPSAVEIATATGERYRAARVLVATNGQVGRLFPDLGVRPARGQVLITDAIPGLRVRGTFHMEEGYYYFRHVGDRVLLGGGRNLDPEGETTWADATTPLIQNRLEQVLREVILPDHKVRIAHRWSGTMGFPSHGKSPVIRMVGERTAVAAGLGGIGVAIGTLVAQQAAELLVRTS